MNTDTPMKADGSVVIRYPPSICHLMCLMVCLDNVLLINMLTAISCAIVLLLLKTKAFFEMCFW